MSCEKKNSWLVGIYKFNSKEKKLTAIWTFEYDKEIHSSDLERILASTRKGEKKGHLPRLGNVPDREARDSESSQEWQQLSGEGRLARS